MCVCVSVCVCVCVCVVCVCVCVCVYVCVLCVCVCEFVFAPNHGHTSEISQCNSGRPRLSENLQSVANRMGMRVKKNFQQWN